MKAIKEIVCIALYVIISIIKFPFGLLGLAFLWIEKIHINMLSWLVEWGGDCNTKASFNALLDTNATYYKVLGEKWFLPMKIEL